MKTCTKCGKVVDSKFCPDCGAPTAEVMPDKQVEVSRNAAAEDQQTVYVSDNVSKKAVGEVTMRWHKWIVNFVLWVWMITHLLNAVISFELAPIKGGMFAVVQYVMMVLYGVIAIGDVYMRFQLARFKQGAVKKFQWFMIATAAIVLVDMISLTAVGLEAEWSNWLVSVAWMFGNTRYYSSREHLFVN